MSKNNKTEMEGLAAPEKRLCNRGIADVETTDGVFETVNPCRYRFGIRNKVLYLLIGEAEFTLAVKHRDREPLTRLYTFWLQAEGAGDGDFEFFKVTFETVDDSLRRMLGFVAFSNRALFREDFTDLF